METKPKSSLLDVVKVVGRKTSDIGDNPLVALSKVICQDTRLRKARLLRCGGGAPVVSGHV